MTGNPINGHTYGTDPITGYKTIDGLIVGIDRAPACRGGRKAVRHILAGFGAEEFTTAGVEAAIKAHDKTYMAKATEHWQVWHEFYQAAAKPVNTFGEWYHNAIGDAMSGVARDNPELLVRLSVRMASRSRWQVVVSQSSFQGDADRWAAEQEKVAAEAAREMMGVSDEPTLVEGGVDVVGITLPAPAEPYFTAFVRERNTYKRVRLRSENRDTAAQEVAKSNPGADLIEVFVHEGLIYTQQWAEVKALQVADNG